MTYKPGQTVRPIQHPHRIGVVCGRTDHGNVRVMMQHLRTGQVYYPVFRPEHLRRVDINEPIN